MIEKSWMQRIIVTEAVDYRGVIYQRIFWEPSRYKLSCYQYRDPHYKNKTFTRPCYFTGYPHTWKSLCRDEVLGLYSLRRRRLISIGIPIINLRRSSDRLRFIMWIPIPVRRRFLSEQRPWCWAPCQIIISCDTNNVNEPLFSTRKDFNYVWHHSVEKRHKYK